MLYLASEYCIQCKVLAHNIFMSIVKRELWEGLTARNVVMFYVNYTANIFETNDTVIIISSSTVP